VAGAHPHPDAERDGAHGGQRLGDDPQPAGKDGATDSVSVFGSHLLVVPPAAVPGTAVAAVAVAIPAAVAAAVTTVAATVAAVAVPGLAGTVAAVAAVPAGQVLAGRLALHH